MGTLLLFPGVVTAQAAVGPFDGNSALLAAVVAFLLPPILAVPMQAGWSSQAKAVVAFVVCLGVAAVIVYVNGMLDAADYVRTALIVLTVTQATYQGFWRPSGVSPAILSATSREAA